MRRIISALGWMLFGLLVAVLVIYIMHARGLPGLSPWHQQAMAKELWSNEFPLTDFKAYQRREMLEFERLQQLIDSGELLSDRRWSRYQPAGESNPLSFEHNWNRTFEQRPVSPTGAALLVHGLSDSPYSMRSISTQLLNRSMHVVALRMPGHGTVPGALATVDLDDYREVYELAIRHLHEGLVPGQPLVLVGYSNGTSLAVDYTLRSLGDDSLVTPDLLILLSPAMSVSPVAAFARVQRLVSEVPGLEKLAWTSNVPEYDPYKYNSFPVQAAEHIYQLTGDLQRELLTARDQGLLPGFPRLLVFQSVVDSTIAPASVVSGLLEQLQGSPAELVLFDVNRRSDLFALLNNRFDSFVDSVLQQSSSSYGVSLLTSHDGDNDFMLLRQRRQGGELWRDEMTGMQWPEGVYSLSHVALPFPCDDPVYGMGKQGLMGLGELSARGERGVFGISMDQLSRLRCNPFYELVSSRIARSLDQLPASNP